MHGHRHQRGLRRTTPVDLTTTVDDHLAITDADGEQLRRRLAPPSRRRWPAGSRGAVPRACTETLGEGYIPPELLGGRRPSPSATRRP